MIELRDVVKGHTYGEDKARPPEETVAEVRRRLAGFRITTWATLGSSAST